MTPTKKLARTAGALYLLLAITGMFSLMYVPSQLIVPGDAMQTAKNITNAETLFRAGIISGLVCQTCFVMLVVLLYQLLKHVNKLQALLMVAFVITAVPIAFLNSVNEFATLILLSGDSYLQGFTTEQLNGLVMVFLKLHSRGILVAEIFWGLWLFPLGYLVYTSNMFPKILGVFLMVACFAYLLDFFITVFIPDYSVLTIPGSIISGVAEFSLVLWLLIKGSKEPQHSL